MTVAVTNIRFENIYRMAVRSPEFSAEVTMDHALVRLENMDAENEVQSVEYSCEDARDLLYLFITNDLEEKEAQQVCTHLLNCEACREAMAEHVKLSGALKRSIPGIQLRYYSSNN